MKTVPDLLRDADPVAAEPRRSAADRQVLRQRVLTMPRTPSQRQPRRMAIAAAIVMVFALAAGALLWPHATTDVVAAVRFEARLAEAVPTLGLRPVRVAHSDRTIYLHDGAIVTNSDIASARVVPGDGDTFNVAIQFTPQGEAKMLSATRTHIGRPIAILLDGDVVMAPTVRSAIGNAATITGSFPKTEADRIVGGIIGR